MVVTGVEQGGSVTARQQALIGFMDAVGRRLDQGMQLDEGSPVGEVVKMLTNARPEVLEEIGAWSCVLWDKGRR